MNCEKAPTGKPSEDRRWMQYYPEMMLKMIQKPECTLWEYLEQHCPGPDVVAIHYYGEDITWKTVFEESEKCARSLRAMGFGEGDQIPVFFRLVPNFVFLLLAAEKIGASLLCRDNTLLENVEAVSKADAKAIFAHDFLAPKELRTYCEGAGVKKVILLNPMYYGDESTLPDYIKESLDENYPRVTASGENTMTWDEFLSIGNYYVGKVEAEKDLNRPLFRAYTSGSTGPSKQVIHCANSMLGTVCQMNFYGGSDDVRPTWMVTCLPPALVAVVVSMVLLPLSSNKLLIMDPFVDPEDVDLEMMRYKPNGWPMIPMFIEAVMRNGRVPEDYVNWTSSDPDTVQVTKDGTNGCKVKLTALKETTEPVTIRATWEDTKYKTGTVTNTFKVNVKPERKIVNAGDEFEMEASISSPSGKYYSGNHQRHACIRSR